MALDALADLQHAVQRLLLQRSLVQISLLQETSLQDSVLQDSLSLEKSLPADFIVATTAVTRETRLEIYANAYRARCVDALAADFSALQGYLGDAEFERLVHAYIETYPSQHFSLRYLGGQLCDFVYTHAPYNEHRDIYELAQFEWALCHAFDAADADTLGIEELRRIDAAAWPELQLQFHPSLRLLLLFGNAPALWHALNDEHSPPQFVVENSARPWIVWRHQLRLLFRPLLENEMLVLEAFRADANFAQACERLSEVIAADQVPATIAALIQQWLGDGLIVKASPER
jgi:hypothetical protein